MPSFAGDCALSPDDGVLVAAAARGEKRALKAICQRFKVPVLAMALEATGDLQLAVEAVEPVLMSLCRDLLSRRFALAEFSLQAAVCVRKHCQKPTPAPPAGTGLDGLRAIPRVHRRRAVRDTLVKLPLAELVAILLQYIEQMRPEHMVGLVADNAEDAQQLLLAAHQKLLDAIGKLNLPADDAAGVSP